MSIRIAKETAPSTPPTDKAYIYLDTADNIPKVKNDAGTVYSMAGATITGTPANNQIMTATSSTAIQGESALTFDGTTLALTGNMTVSGTVDGRDVSVDGTKLDFITVTQAVNLDTIESDTATNNAKVTNATHTGDVTGSTDLTIANDAVTNAKAANMAVNTIKGRITAGTGDPEDLTGSQVRTVIGLSTTDTPIFAGVTCENGFLGINSSAPAITISGGVITATDSFHQVDTEASAATDDLDTINGFASGRILVLRTVNASRDIVVKHATGNLRLAGGVDFTLANTTHLIMFLGSTSGWNELCRSANA
jgi:hypothetical protein